MKSGLYHKVPIILVDPANGEELRFESMSAAARSIGVRPGQIQYAWLFGHKCRGYLVKKEEELVEFDGET